MGLPCWSWLKVFIENYWSVSRPYRRPPPSKTSRAVTITLEHARPTTGRRTQLYPNTSHTYTLSYVSVRDSNNALFWKITPWRVKEVKIFFFTNFFVCLQFLQLLNSSSTFPDMNSSSINVRWCVHEWLDGPHSPLTKHTSPPSRPTETRRRDTLQQTYSELQHTSHSTTCHVSHRRPCH